MAKYIDAEKVKEALTDTLQYEGMVMDELISVVNNIPAADVVEVIRCKECKWKQGSECVRFADVRPFPDDFCSRAERRTDE